MGKIIKIPAAGLRAALLAWALCGCTPDTTYAVDPDTAQHELVGSQIPAIAFGMAGHAEPGEPMAGGVAWHVFRDDGAPGWSPGTAHSQELLVLTAKIAPSGQGTEVAVDVAPTANTPNTNFAKLMSEKPALIEMFRSIVREQVDSRLTHRDFNFAPIRASMAVAMVSMLPEIRQQMDRASAQSEREDRQRIDDAYSSAGQTHSPSPPTDYDTDRNSNADWGKPDAERNQNP